MNKLVKRFLSLALAFTMVLSYIPVNVFAEEAGVPALPTATVAEIKNEELTFAMNFSADAVTPEQFTYYGDWYTDFELTINKDVTFNANGGADGFLSGQYDAWSENWVNVPFDDVTLEEGETLRIMEYAAEMMGQSGLKYTFEEVFRTVQDFKCGVYFEPEFLAANPDLEVTLELKIYNSDNEAENYVIGKRYTYTIENVAPNLPTATVTEIKNDELTFALNFKADEATEEQIAYYGDWYADYVLTINKDVTFNADGGADGYLSGQYDDWSENWVNVPFENVTLAANQPLKIMDYAAKMMGQSGLKLTYNDVYSFVEDFDCGIFLEDEFIAENPDLVVTLELRMYNPANEAESYVIGETYVYTIENVAPNLPTATVTKIKNDNLTFALNFKADEATEEQLDYYGDWYADYVLTVNKDVTFNANGGADGYLSGQYEAWSENWVNVPFENVTLTADQPLKIMEYAAEMLDQSGLKLTYNDVYTSVKDFDCGVYFTPEFLAANKDLVVTLELRMYNPADETESYVIGETYIFMVPGLPTATVTKIKNDDLTFALNFKADEATDAQLDFYGDWYADYVLTVNKDVTFNANGGANGYLSGQYDTWSENWVNVPFENVTLTANQPLKIMDYAAKMMGQSGLKLTYNDVYTSVKDFDCGVFFEEEFLEENTDLVVTLELRMYNPANEAENYVIGDTYVYTIENVTPNLPTATVTEIDNDELTFALNFKADEVSDAQLEFYRDWYADYVLTVNKDVTFNANGGADGYLSGQYEAWSENWVDVPFEDVTLTADQPLKIMEYAAEMMDQSGLKLTYNDVYTSVKDFDCGVFFEPEFLVANPDIEVTLELRMYNPENEEESYVIGETYIFTLSDEYVACNVQTGKFYNDLAVALTEAEEGETVKIVKDIETDTVIVPESVTLDLNGLTLEAGYVASFGTLVDNSEENTGVLAVSAKRFLIQPGNEQLPVRTTDGYVFVEVIKMNTAFTSPSSGDAADIKFVFQPFVETAAHEALKAGAASSGTNVVLRAAWVSGDTTRYQDFVYNDQLVNKVIGSYNPNKGSYTRMFTLELKNGAQLQAEKGLEFTVYLVSETGVEATYIDKATTTTEATTINTDGGSSAYIPEGTKLDGKTDELTLTVSALTKSESNIKLEENEVQTSVDVHVDGIAKDNKVPMLITIKELAAKGLNSGNLKLYHIENGKTNAMTQVAALADVDAHNEFFYEPSTGDVTMALATFSEVAVVSDATKAWEGNFDYSWYTNAVAPVDGETVTEYTIANADQLAAFGAIVGGMNGQTQDSFAGKTVKLIADINLGDAEEKNNPNIIFYPIGYNSSDGKYEKTGVAVTTGFYNFSGTFDGNGHTISNFYHNTWEMKGDHNWYDATLQYYRDGMGLFGKVYGGTVKNLTVRNFKSDGEIATTGVIAAYADGATFENISIFDCNPRVYNIGNGGIVGCVGWYAKEADLKTTFKNITVDNSNKISALWGSYDVACGGIVGQYYPTSGQSSAGTPANGGISFENCHVSAQMDVYNDVCANYQYYAYRYAGMLIGSVRENETTNGHVYPKMDGITAEACTVHFGTWNDYYYCEIIDNTTASYTHDYQMSRLTEIKAIDGTTITYLDGTTGTVPTSGRANYVIVDYSKGHGTENATCYHFKDGKVWNHEDGGKETINGVEVLKEDKQHIYLEFNNLVTGDGWGVTTKAVGDLAGVTILDREVADSVEKFSVVFDGTKIKTGTELVIGDLFKALEKPAVAINTDAIMVSVTPVGDESTANGVYTPNPNDWTQGKLEFSGKGKAKISITDYFFCTPTVIEVEINGENKFETKFTGDFLYRVGNQNTVALGGLFEEVSADIVEDKTVKVTIEAIDNTAASGTYTANTTDWTKGTIKFNDTGVVKVSIEDADSIPFELNLEVVDAYNANKNGGDYAVKNRNTVMVEDIQMPVNGNLWLENVTLYGNGFRFDVTAAKDGNTTNGYIGGNYAIALKNAILDNVQIIGEVYTQYGATAKAMYNYPTILTNGDSIIANSYISNCAAPVRAQDGNLEIINSTLEGGIFCNLDIRGGTVTLDDVTTINQSYADGRSISNDKRIVGLGIAFYECNVNAKLIVKTDDNGNPLLKQYNCMSQNVTINDTTVSQLKSAIFGSNHADLQFTDSNGVKWVNTGIMSATEGVGVKNISEIKGYTGKSATVAGKNGYVYTPVPQKYDDVIALPGAYKSKEQYHILPNVSFNHKAEQNYKAPSDDSNEFCYYNEDTKQLEISFDEGENKVYDPNILTVTKTGQTLPYTVKINGVDYTGKTITFDTAGEYTAEYSYTDPYNFRKAGEDVEDYSIGYNKTVKISVSVVEATAKDAEFTFYGYSSVSKTAATTITDVKTVTSSSGNIYIMPSSTGTYLTITTIYGIKVNCPRVYVDFKDNTSDFNWLYPVFLGVKIEDYADGGTAETATTIVSPDSTSKPSNLTILTEDKPQGKTGWSSGSGRSGSEGKLGSGTYKNLYGWTSGAIGSDQPANSIYAQFTYKDNKGTTYYYVIEFYRAAHNCPTCIIEGTMITMADGTQKAVENLQIGDMLKVFNHITGEFEAAPLIFNTHIDETEYKEYDVLKLNFEDGEQIGVVAEHGFFDTTLMQYVYIGYDNYNDYIGHYFYKLADDGVTTERVKLESAFIEKEVTRIFCPVTYAHMNSISNGVLNTPSIPGGITGLVNYFEYDEDLKYNEEAMQRDIETYGLYTYEDFSEYVSEEAFNSFPAIYFKVAVGKGMLTYEQILDVIEYLLAGSLIQ